MVRFCGLPSSKACLVFEIDHQIAIYRWATIAFARVLGWPEPESRKWFLRLIDSPGAAVAFEKGLETVVAEKMADQLRLDQDSDPDPDQGQVRSIVDVLRRAIGDCRSAEDAVTFDRFAEATLRDVDLAKKLAQQMCTADERGLRRELMLGARTLLAEFDSIGYSELIGWAAARAVHVDHIDWQRVRSLIDEQDDVSSLPSPNNDAEPIRTRDLMERMIEAVNRGFTNLGIQRLCADYINTLKGLHGGELVDY